MRALELTGQRFGRLTAIRYVRTVPGGRVWECLCDCGSVCEVRGFSLNNGYTKSCGCITIERVKSTPLNFRHGMSASPEYDVWSSMRERCDNPKHEYYADYGGRGIRVCERWRDFRNFIHDVGARPSPKHSIDRYPNNNGDYEPGNVRWATRTEQMRNTRQNVFLEHCGVSMCLTDWSEKTGISVARISARLRHGWTPEKILSTPVRRRQ